ncbi:MAG TPA: nuclear transport factor 2 family protein [Candidatus Angelobacter sp.]|jgi:3-phenylpropionate/cinnamic acid dioxygenase small subunit|nr:nuclear transport factor 2 family protein [Candidatus Angelobacter sp.]
MIAAMLTDADQIRNLLFAYAEAIDAGDITALRNLFEHAAITLEGGATWRGRHAGGDDSQPGPWRATASGGGPKGTKHVVSNVIVEFGADGATAQTRATFVVFQATDAIALQPIISGRYHDGFRRIEGAWRFVSRRYIVDLVGNAAPLLGMPDEDLVAMQQRATGWSS